MSKFNVGDKVVFKNWNQVWDGAEAKVVGFTGTTGQAILELTKPNPRNSLYGDVGCKVGAWADHYLSPAPEEAEEETVEEETELFTLSILDTTDHVWRYPVTLVVDEDEDEEFVAFRQEYVGDYVFLIFEHDGGEHAIRLDLLKSYQLNKQ